MELSEKTFRKKNSSPDPLLHKLFIVMQGHSQRFRRGKREKGEWRWADAPHVYKERRPVGCFFGKLKEFRSIATRYGKPNVTFLTMATIASCLIWLR